MAIELRGYQASAVINARAAFAAGKRAPLIVSPTGSGKTVILSWIAMEAARNAQAGRPVDIVAHRQELIEQISGMLTKMGVHHGLISPKFAPDPFALVQVASVQTLALRLKQNPRRSRLLIVDEAHHLLETNQWGKAYNLLGRPQIIGFTATPCRGDGRGLGVEAGGIFDHMIEVIDVKTLIRDGNLVRPVVFGPKQQIDMAGIRSLGGDYQRGELAGRMDKPMITGDAVATYREKCDGIPAVAFGVSIEHCEHIAAEFRAAGYNFQAVDGKMDDTTRGRLIKGLGKDITGLVSADLIGEGVDIPAIGCAILLRPTQSLGLYIQQVGRALRPLEGKTVAYILDHVGNSLNPEFGLPQADRVWTLEGERRKKSASMGGSEKARQCSRCFNVHEPAPACPYCGHVYPGEARGVETQAGELAEVTEEIAAMLKRDKAQEIRSARSIEKLREIEAARGYARGWANHVWAARSAKDAKRGKAASW